MRKRPFPSLDLGRTDPDPDCGHLELDQLSDWFDDPLDWTISGPGERLPP